MRHVVGGSDALKSRRFPAYCAAYRRLVVWLMRNLRSIGQSIGQSIGAGIGATDGIQKMEGVGTGPALVPVIRTQSARESAQHPDAMLKDVHFSRSKTTGREGVFTSGRSAKQPQYRASPVLALCRPG